MLVRIAKINTDSNVDGEHFESKRKIRQAQWINPYRTNVEYRVSS